MAAAPKNLPCPYVLMFRDDGANGRMSHTRTVLSMELESSDWPSGETPRDVTVSWCPRNMYTTDFLRMSHT